MTTSQVHPGLIVPSSTYDFDFRSDTVTLPTKEMRLAMAEAVVGDDVYGEDPMIIKLEQRLAELTGKESALFCVSGTMTNQLGLRVHLQALQEVICDSKSHIYNNENGGAHYHSQASVNALQHTQHHLTAELIERNLHLDHHQYHSPLTRLIELENTLNGMVMPLDEIIKINTLAKKHNLKMHLDGARLWNASIKTGVELKTYCQYFDTISLCFSKGLGAPVGSVLVGSKVDIEKARHFRKLFGGGWRQAGILAQGALYALDHHWSRMKEDHENAAHLSIELVKLGFKLDFPVETNILFINSKDLGLDLSLVAKRLKEKRRIHIGDPHGFSVRLVVHLQISRQAIDALIDEIKLILNEQKK